MTNLLNDINNILLHTEGDKYFNLDNISILPISTIVYGKITFLLEQLNNLNSKGFFIVPAYETKNNKEIQLAVTGKCKYNEKPMDAIKREVAEELGLKINSAPINIIQIPDRQNEIYFSIVKSDKISSNDLLYNSHNNVKDNPNKKVICWIYVENIDEETIFNRLRKKSDDKAGKIISIIPVTVMKMILNKWINKKIKKVSRFSFTI
ncbi:hypothetical protein crov103 [Cafeteria roenbergensis virus]|uniref:Nudix hydrolase domain-containing protein n=1 Tax=Cafeteria roenbergensis virus (strain BV-PW1) TaxID=693272 RepID=E3T4M3_CROVB|nr:hypothetical protein crov103 [Cafeteria roenbergensis virus BV-PW1]ADO67136.1 hypothetical protein crov103 [Cafeteria roenbergensis virus BV-PW1]